MKPSGSPHETVSHALEQQSSTESDVTTKPSSVEAPHETVPSNVTTKPPSVETPNETVPSDVTRGQGEPGGGDGQADGRAAFIHPGV